TLGKPLITIDPASGETTEENLGGLAAARPPAESDPRGSVKRQFEALNREATREGPRARQLVLEVILIHLGAAAVG
ncbi:MAG: hypothetical protein GTO30_16135, partial [Acidobacteria bacterium]|nr:hypothetical protein [Acidobacteriota bacterium]NIQ85755.1 hypothetical protein [Acidobacteriota bacterium]